MEKIGKYKESLFYNDQGCCRLTELGKSLFEPRLVENIGYEYASGYADGQNWWGYRNPETGENIYGSSDICESRGKQYTELPNRYRAIFDPEHKYEYGYKYTI